MEREVEAASETMNRNHDDITNIEAERIEQISRLALLTRHLTGQLVDGCKDPRCSEPLCFTGRSNTSIRPVRKYTARAARGIALSVCSDPALRHHICKYYASPSEQTQGSTETDDGPRDPSSLMQLLCDTTSVRQFGTNNQNQTRGGDSIDQRLEYLNLALDQQLLQSETIQLFSSNQAETNDKIADLLRPALDYLLGKIPLARWAPCQFVDRVVVSKGLAYSHSLQEIPADEMYNTWLIILDNIRHQPHLDLLGRLVKLIALRADKQSVLDTAGNTSVENHCESLSETLLKRYDRSTNRPGALVVWLKALFSHKWKGNARIARRTVCAGIADLLRALRSSDYGLSSELFLMPAVASRIDAVELVQPFLENLGSCDTCLLTCCDFFFTPTQMATYFRVLNHLKMKRSHSASVFAATLHRRTGLSSPEASARVQLAEEHYLLLNIRREHSLQDAFDQLWQRRRVELSRPLRVRLGEETHEVGHDLGGVQIEFFNLVCHQVLSEEAQMFTTDPKTGCSYFKPGSLQPLHMFELFGLLIALALYNGITVPVRFPLEFYRQLRSPVPMGIGTAAIDRVGDAWPTAAKSLHYILESDVDDLEFTFPVEANGLRMAVLMTEEDNTDKGIHTWTISNASAIKHHAEADASQRQEVRSSVDTNAASIGIETSLLDWPGLQFKGSKEEPRSVTASNKVLYVSMYCRWLTYMSVAPQLEAFLKGFHSIGVFEDLSLSILGPERLKHLLEGDDRFEVSELKAATTYDGYDPRSSYMQKFWRIVSSWPEDKQKQLLKFVTAVERIPLGGPSNLTFVIKRIEAATEESLPTSSTCFGTLYLPHYPGGLHDVLAKRLDTAVTYGSEGFGQG